MDSPIYHLEHVVKAKAENLEDFTGPLDLILHLLSKNKMEIQDIQIALILEQYLEWMDRRRELDLEVASEFVAMASHLVYIKTRMLLSIHDEEALTKADRVPGGPPAQRELSEGQSGGGPAGPAVAVRPGLHPQAPGGRRLPEAL